jgi:hypothetical protein
LDLDAPCSAARWKALQQHHERTLAGDQSVELEIASPELPARQRLSGRCGRHADAIACAA